MTREFLFGICLSCGTVLESENGRCKCDGNCVRCGEDFVRSPEMAEVVEASTGLVLIVHQPCMEPGDTIA